MLLMIQDFVGIWFLIELDSCHSIFRAVGMKSSLNQLKVVYVILRNMESRIRQFLEQGSNISLSSRKNKTDLLVSTS